jgi:zinc/manganese transport system substrate-binding protein
MKLQFIGMLALFAAAASPSYAAFKILACEPEWGSLSRELGGDKVDVYTATTAQQDAHRIEARPSLIARARSADLMVCTGAELEIGWVPLLLSQSGNPNIQVGRPGYFEAAMQVRLIEVPTQIDRSLGDVHPLGNPHLHLDPRNIARVATALTERMAELDRGNAAYYRERATSFQQRWKDAMVRWEKDAAPLKGMGLITYHKDFNYFIAWAGMRELGNLEPKPGLPPTTAHMSELLQGLSKTSAQAVVRTPFQDPRAAQFLAERAKIPIIMMAYTIGGTDRAKDLFSLYDDTIARLVAVAK